jgi:L-lactate dehydrogenase (cytochrome)
MSGAGQGVVRTAGGITASMRATSSVPRRLRMILSLEDFEHAARRYLPRPLFGYVSGATEDGQSLVANKAAYAQFDLVPRVLVDVGSRDQSTSLLGRTYRHPFGIAPMGMSALMAYDGDVTLARQAAEAGIPFIMSAASLTRLERVADEGRGRWFQAYLPGDEQRIEAMVDRVAAAGYDTFVLTADVPVASNRENNVRTGFDSPLRPSLSLAWQGVSHPGWLVNTAMRTLARHGMPHFDNMDAFRGPPILSRNLVRFLGNRDQLTWRHLELIRKRWKGSLVVKGLLAPEDARLAREAGADGIIVSNHGGRQLDGSRAPLAALPAIREVAGDMAVVDSGIRRGTDVLKALALGADFVFVGRPFLYAASYAGDAGVQHAIRLLAEELDRDMALLGVRTVGEVSAAHVCRRGGNYGA